MSRTIEHASAATTSVWYDNCTYQGEDLGINDAPRLSIETSGLTLVIDGETHEVLRVITIALEQISQRMKIEARQAKRSAQEALAAEMAKAIEEENSSILEEDATLQPWEVELLNLPTVESNVPNRVWRDGLTPICGDLTCEICYVDGYEVVSTYGDPDDGCGDKTCELCYGVARQEAVRRIPRPEREREGWDDCGDQTCNTCYMDHVQ